MKHAITLALVGVISAYRPAIQPKPPTGSLAAVVRLYQDYAWEAVLDEPMLSGTLAAQPRAILERYFDEQLVALFVKDRECSARTKQNCSLDFVPIWDGQDPGGLTVRIVQGKDSTRVVVTVRNATRVDVSQLTYAMVKTSAGWRIHDIAYNSHESLGAMLRRKP